MPEAEFPWPVPVCTKCGVEFDALLITPDAGLDIAYSCGRHGMVSLVDPFDFDMPGC